MLNDLLTLTKIREGDIKAFEDVFRRYYSPLCWYAMSITGSMEAAEEIVEGFGEIGRGCRCSVL